MTTKLKLLLITTLVALLTLSVVMLSSGARSEKVSSTAQLAQSQHTHQTRNSVAILFNQVQLAANAIFTQEQMNPILESKDFTPFLSLVNNARQIPVEYAIYDARENTVHRLNQQVTPGEYYGLENVILSQVKSAGRQIMITRVDNTYSLVSAYGTQADGQLIGVGLSILPLDQRLLAYLKQSTGAEFQLKLNSTVVSTDNQQNFSNGLMIDWPVSTKMKPEIVFLKPAWLNSLSEDASILPLVVIVVLMLGLIVLVFIIIRAQHQGLKQVTDAVSNITSPNQLIAELNQISPPQEISELNTLIKSWISKLSSQNKTLTNQLRVLESQISDIQGEKEALQEERDSAVKAPKTKSEFLSRMGDEITTPMKTLSSMLHLLSEYNLQEEPKELLNIARRSANTLINNLNNILDFSKLDANLLKLHKSDFDVKQLFEEVASEYGAHAESKSLKLSAHVSPDVPESIYNDPRRVRQIMKNLIGNAVRFTKEGEVKLSCDIVMHNSEQFLRITVKDTGVGIPKEAQQGLFDSLQQKTKLTNSSFAGRLRLIVSKKLSELMGGSIGVESEPQQGSTFWFTVAINK